MHLEYDSGRRRFLGISAAYALGTLLGINLNAEATAPGVGARPFDAWIRILPGGRVVLLVAKAEMGQGVLTALPMILAEELDVEWANVEVQQAPVDPSKYDHLTVGSDSIQSLWLPLRRAGATARQQLIRAAAVRWKASPDVCSTDRGFVVGPLNQRVGYADLVSEASAFTTVSAADAELKSVAQFRIIGRSHRRIDAPSKVNGSAVYGMDVRVPRMLRAVVARCPIVGGGLRSFDRDAAMSVAGVRSVFPIAPEGRDAFTRGGVAVVAENSWAALQGRRRLNIDWSHPTEEAISSEAIRASLHRNTRRAGSVVAERRHVLGEFAKAGQTVRATFEVPFVAHATMEPMNATVHVRADAVEAWLPTQNAADARAAIARVLLRPAESITIHQTMIGGGFGRRDATDFAVEAAQVAAIVGVPVQLFWSREDDIQFDHYRPMAVHSLSASLDSRGFPTAWLDRMSSTSIAAFLEPHETAKPAGTEVGGARDLPYDIPTFRMEYTPVRCSIPVGWWRSVADSINAFAVECFIDDLAAAAKQDPLNYRLTLLPNGRRVAEPDRPVIESDRLRRVVISAASQAGWHNKVSDGRALGLACHACRGSYIAVVVEASISASRVTVHRIWAAVDCGLVLNPLGLEAQIEGGLLFGTSAALYEAITVQNGKVRQTNFNDYRLLRIDSSPQTTVLIIPSNALPTGVGEIAVPPVAPAIANAIFRLTGRRPRRLPIQPYPSKSS
jgi:isoquinoline 1-oxidoreductase beta subunit